MAKAKLKLVQPPKGVRKTPEVIRQEIEDGVYETPQKLDFAVDRMIDGVGQSHGVVAIRARHRTRR